MPKKSTTEKKEKEKALSLPELYFPGLTGDPFKDDAEEKEYYLRFLDMLCLISVDLNENHPDISLDRVGSILSDEQLMRSLEPHAHIPYPRREELKHVYLRLLRRSEESVQAGRRTPISMLLDSGMLDKLEMLAVLLAYSASVNRKYERIYAVLQAKKEECTRPTIGLCLDIAGLILEDEEKDAAVLLREDSFLNTVLLEARDKSRAASEMAAPLKLKASVLKLLLAADDDLGELNRCAELLSSVDPEAQVIRKEEAAELISAYNGMMASGGGVIDICAPEGSGRRFIAGKLAAQMQCRLLSVNVSAMLSFNWEMQNVFLGEILIRGILAGDIIYLYDLPRDLENALIRVFTTLQDKISVIITGNDSPVDGSLAGIIKGSIYRMNLKPIGDKEQKILWEEAASEFGVSYSDDLDLEEIVSKYTMNPGRIFHAVKNSMSLIDIDEEIDKELLQEQIRRICAVDFGETAKRLESPFVWDDLVVERESEILLKQVCDRVRFKSRVNVDFGFGAKLPYGRGLSVVFYGPPGTGKTMAAQVLANTLGLDIYRIDLSQVSSKYIGETEKNLGVVFEAAKNSNAILFFDEADSLFSKRTNVNSSNDRYANAETSYLLQKVEEYSGMSILATNNMQNFDAAFKRRMSFIIPIGMPDEPTRALLWKKAFPKDAPLAKDVDFEVLSKAVEMSGSSIKSAAVSAAYLAAAADSKINMEFISIAVERECLKNGRTGARNDILRVMMEG